MLKAHFCIPRKTKMRETEIDKEREAPVIRMGTLTNTHSHLHSQTHTHTYPDKHTLTPTFTNTWPLPMFSDRSECVCVWEDGETTQRERRTLAGQRWFYNILIDVWREAGEYTDMGAIKGSSEAKNWRTHVLNSLVVHTNIKHDSGGHYFFFKQLTFSRIVLVWDCAFFDLMWWFYA